MSTETEQPLYKMSLATLTEYSVRELAKYRRKEPCDDKYCLEIFRRAVMLHDNYAWIALQRQFGENVRLWLGGHSHRELALRYESEQTYIDDAFRRFWQAVSDQSLSFTTIASALSYLRLCLHCAIMDTLRAYARVNIEPIPEHGHPDEPQVEDRYHENEFWETIKSLLPGEKEQRVAYLHFHCNLKPREIIRYCPGEFNNEEEIYRLKRNIVERIQRNANMIRWKLDGHVFA
jgi:hypothetical protein